MGLDALRPDWRAFLDAWNDGAPEPLAAAAQAVIDHPDATGFARAEACSALTALAIDAKDWDAAQAAANDARSAAASIAEVDARARSLGRLLWIVAMAGDALRPVQERVVKDIAATGTQRRNVRKQAAGALAEAEALRRLLEHAGDKKADVLAKAREQAKAAWHGFLDAADLRGAHAAQTVLDALR